MWGLCPPPRASDGGWLPWDRTDQQFIGGIRSVDRMFRPCGGLARRHGACWLASVRFVLRRFASRRSPPFKFASRRKAPANSARRKSAPSKRVWVPLVLPKFIQFRFASKIFRRGASSGRHRFGGSVPSRPVYPALASVRSGRLLGGHGHNTLTRPSLFASVRLHHSYLARGSLARAAPPRIPDKPRIMRRPSRRGAESLDPLDPIDLKTLIDLIHTIELMDIIKIMDPKTSMEPTDLQDPLIPLTPFSLIAILA
jgi:hypothetical protein